MSQAQSKATQFVTETGRIVWGSLYDPVTTDYDNNPLVIKSGPDTGKPTQRFEFGLAIAKKPGEAHWANSALGAIIWAQGHKDHPQMAQRPDFAWKITDGDSAIPNKKGGIPNSKEGFPGHWVFKLSSSYAPKICNADGSAWILDKDAVKCGDYVQVAGTVAGNTGATPGVYLNHNIVAFQGHGTPIVSGPDPKTLGFGAGPKPAGMSATPVGAMSAPPVTPAVPGTPVVPAVPGAAVAPPPVPQTAVAPHPGILVPAVPPAAPAAPAIPTAAPSGGPVMTAKAGAFTFAQFIANGWTEANLRAQGYIV